MRNKLSQKRHSRPTAHGRRRARSRFATLLVSTLAALGWTYCFARAGTWSRALSWLSVPLWLAMGVAVISPLLPAAIRPSAHFVSSANGVGFLLLQLWLALVTEQVLVRRRPYQARGRLAIWRHPGSGPFARFIDVMSAEFQRLAVFGDWSHLYLTMDFRYQAAIARALGRFVEQGLVYKGKKPVHWCIHCRTALAEAEVEYEDHTSPSIYVEFPLDPSSAAELGATVAKVLGSSKRTVVAT